MRVLIVANGEVSELGHLKNACEQADFIIAVDGGMRYLMAIDIAPNLWVGDMDSSDFKATLQNKHADWLDNVEIARFPVEKDMSDTELAIDLAIENGATEMILMGMLGGRVDHMLLNISLLVSLNRKGIPAYIEDEAQRLFLIDKSISFDNLQGCLLSIVPITDLEGVTIEGCYYPLDKAQIKLGATVGLSNIINSDKVTVSVSKGMGYVIITKHEKSCTET